MPGPAAPDPQNTEPTLGHKDRRTAKEKKKPKQPKDKPKTASQGGKLVGPNFPKQ